MNEGGRLSLKWNNHKVTFFHLLSNLRKSEFCNDATIACEGKYYPVHKLVLSTCSDYFSEIFDKTTCKCPVIILNSIKPHEIESLLDYMYSGEVEVKQSELAGIVKAAECLRIKGLAAPDEDPSLFFFNQSSARSPKSFNNKRPREENENSEDPQYFPLKAHRSLSPNNLSKSSTPPPVPQSSSQSVESEICPSSSQPISVSSSNSVIITTESTSSSSIENILQNNSPANNENSIPPTFIKIEPEDGKSAINKYPSSSLENKDEEEPEIDNILINKSAPQQELANSYQEYSNSHVTLNKTDEIESYSESQIAGTSGVQGNVLQSQQLMTCYEEDSNFHQLFTTGEDGTPQQVCIATLDPEMVAVRMFEVEGGKVQVQQLQRIPQIQQQGSTKLVFVQEQNHEAKGTPVIQSMEPPTIKALLPPLLKSMHSHPSVKNRKRKRTSSSANTSLPSITTTTSSSSHHQVQFISDHNLQPTMVTSLQLQPMDTTTATLQPLEAMTTTQQPSYKVEIAPRIKKDCESADLQQTVTIQRIDEQTGTRMPLIHLAGDPQHHLEGGPATVQLTVKEELSTNTSSNSLNESSSTATSTNTVAAALKDASRRLHACNYCLYSSRSKVDMNKHVRVHTREKPYKCNMCKYETGDRSNYRRHMNGLHKLQEFEIPILNSASTVQSSKRYTTTQRSSSEMNEIAAANQDVNSAPLAVPIGSIAVISMPPISDQCPATSAV